MLDSGEIKKQNNFKTNWPLKEQIGQCVSLDSGEIKFKQQNNYKTNWPLKRTNWPVCIYRRFK